jgi:hypothetical protein
MHVIHMHPGITQGESTEVSAGCSKCDANTSSVIARKSCLRSNAASSALEALSLMAPILEKRVSPSTICRTALPK